MEYEKQNLLALERLHIKYQISDILEFNEKHAQEQNRNGIVTLRNLRELSKSELSFQGGIRINKKRC